ncbi:hypothetical protein ABNJ21_000336 [Klebsiella michiganensis]
MNKLWGLFFTVLVSNSCIADDAMPSSTTLLKNFDKLGIVEKGKWKNGESPDGIKTLIFRDVGDIYSLNPDFASSVSLTKGEKNKEEFLHSEEVCKKFGLWCGRGKKSGHWRCSDKHCLWCCKKEDKK